jgi:hypothetical protein
VDNGRKERRDGRKKLKILKWSLYRKREGMDDGNAKKDGKDGRKKRREWKDGQTEGWKPRKGAGGREELEEVKNRRKERRIKRRTNRHKEKETEGRREGRTDRRKVR